MTIIAIDPGQSGGVAVFENNSTVVWPMPETVGDLIAELRVLKERNGSAMVFLEELVKHTGKKLPASTMAVYARNYGNIEGACQALGLRLELVTSGKWQKHFALGTARSCENKRVWKNKLKAEAQRRYPDIKITLATSDALLMLEWAKARNGGLVS